MIKLTGLSLMKAIIKDNLREQASVPRIIGTIN